MTYVLRFEDEAKIPFIKKWIERGIKEFAGVNLGEYHVEQVGNCLLIAVKNMERVLEGKSDYMASVIAYKLEKVGTKCEIVKTGEYEDREKILEELNNQNKVSG